MSADTAREVPEDALGLLALLGGRLGLPVVELDDLERLDEKRLTRAGRVVDDAGKAAPRARLHGEHRPASALHDEALLQVRTQGGRARHALKRLLDVLPAGAQLAAKSAQSRRRRVAQSRAVVVDARVDLVGEG